MGEKNHFLEPGTEVRILAESGLGKAKLGVVVAAPDKRGFCTIALGSMQVRVRSEHLERVERRRPKSEKPRAASPGAGTTLRLDLHGMRKTEALEALERLLDTALRQGASRLEIIHGLGTGTLRDAVHSYLRRSSHVQNFQLDVSNPGTTWAHL
ncbi:MAG: Smr/MutS family protein [Bdellovibrionales bacterium]|nr:Smr/MutS family protein [Bdellovibrionales bacterium]